ncbi:MAG: DNA circularization N-terminal domain-containing protein [Eubacteriales bacterium]|nr:DNA circularization N-terminal domain-containing protein [Eubacteriales bacterium]
MMKISYKDHLWPVNPHTYRDEMSRTAHYETVDGVSQYAGISPIIRRITGQGVFCGEGAYQKLLDLQALFADPKPGNLVHPVWGSCYCYFTELELTQEPRESYVSYRFTFTGALPNGEIPR